MDRRRYSVSESLFNWALSFLEILDLPYTSEGDQAAIAFLKKLPHEKIVCPVCRGEGHHVNPSIDEGGLTAEDFAEDPDFEEAYFSGRYDVPCVECGGANVVDEIAWNRVDVETRESWYAWRDDEARYRAEAEAERRMGA